MVKPCYYKGERGNKPFDPELMLRIHMLQKPYNPADTAVMNEIIEPCKKASCKMNCPEKR